MDEGNFDFQFLPKSLREKLLPFQRKGVQYAIQKHGRCLIGDEMGLGKTIQAISVAYYYRSEWPLLVVLPSSMKYPWIEELEKWLPCLQPKDINLITSSTDVSNISKAAISLVGYGLMQSTFKTLLEALHKQNFKVIIVDESHFLKNAKAARTKTLIPLLKKATRVLMLSGTPALARPSELYSQINCLSEGLFGSWTSFTKRYCNARWKFFGRMRMWDTSGASNLPELHKKLTTSIMIRREKKEVLTELPPKRRQKVPFELSESKQKKELDALWSELGSYLKGDAPDSGKDAGFEIRRLSMDLYISTGKAKIAAVSEYVKMLLDNQDMKFLVFAHHKEILTAIVQTTQAYSREKEPTLKYIRIDGDVPPIERMNEVNRFQQDPNVRVAALSIMAAGTGLTLTAASHVVFAELHWTPGVLEQCEDRAHRIGQKNAIHVHYLVAKGTIDEWMWSTLNRKVGVLSSTLNGRVQHMNANVLGGGIGEFLKQATFWMPSSLDKEEDDSFFFSQTPKKPQSRDIRSYMQSSQSSRKGTVSQEKRVIDEPPPVISLLDDSDDSEDAIPGKEIGTLTKGNLGNGGSSTSTVTNNSNSPLLHQVTRLSTPLASPSQSSGEPTNSYDDRMSSTFDSTKVNIGDYEQTVLSDPASGSSKPINDMESSESSEELITGVGFSSRQRLSSKRSCDLIRDASPSCHKTPSPVFKSKMKVGEAAHKTQKIAGKIACGNSDLGADRDPEVSTTRWNCPACTFLNHNSLPLCELCNTPRKRKGNRTRVNTRSRVKKRLKDGNDSSPKVVLETMSDSDDDFEMLTRVHRKPTEREKDLKGKKSLKALRVKGQKVIDNKNDGKTAPVRDILSKHGSPVIRLVKEETPAKKLKSVDGSPGPEVPPHHGIEVSDSDSDDGVLKLDPLRTNGSDQTTTKSEPSYSKSICRSLQSVSYKPSHSMISKHSDNGSKVKVKSKGSLLERQDEIGSSSSSKQRRSLEEEFSDALFSDEEGYDGKVDEDAVEEKTFSQSDIDIEVKGAVECLLNSPLNSRSEVKPWTCTEPVCQYINTSSNIECENCWASRPRQLTVEVGPSPGGHKNVELGQSPGFTTASKVLAKEGHTQMHACKEKLLSPVYLGSELRLVQTEADCTGKAITKPCQKDTKELKAKTESERVKGGELSEDMESTSQETPMPKIFEGFLYCASKFTDRIYLYDMDQQSLDCAFLPLDIRTCDLHNLPDILQLPQNMKVVRRFLKEWDSLTELKKRKLRKSGLIFDSPTAAMDALMKKRPFQLSTRRFLTKDDLANAALQKAEDVGGSTRIIQKKPAKASLHVRSPPKSSSLQFVKSPVAGKKRKMLPDEVAEESDERQESQKKIRPSTDGNDPMSKSGFVQALSADGSPLCVFCNGPVVVTSFSNSNAAWDTRYCSEGCKEENQVLWKSSKYVREQLLEAEHGVCQICNLEAHTIYRNLRDLQKSKRKQFLSQTAYSGLSVKQLNEMIRNPMEGQFWHADHIVPVYKGGGLCSLENFRTLCVLCHTKVTAEQSHERKGARTDEANRKAGLRDIRKYLQDNG